jgi:regulator-associated protein of mTOR
MQRAMAAFVLATIAESNPKGQLVCHQSNLLAVCAMSLQHLLHDAPRSDDAAQGVCRTVEAWDAGTELLAKWLCLCLGNLWSQFPEIQVRRAFQFLVFFWRTTLVDAKQ